MSIEIHEIDAIDAVLEPFEWTFPRDHAEEIGRTWARFANGNDRIFNGQVLMQYRGAVDGRVFRAGYFETEYRSFLGYLRSDVTMPQVRNGFGMAALRARDGAFLLGEMAAGTANAGKIYFAAGTPDLDDLIGTTVDLAGSVQRELEEETGLTPADVVFGGWAAVSAGKRVAFMRQAFIDLPAEEARKMMLGRMRASGDDELSDIRILRAGDALLDDVRLPDFCSAYIRHSFARD